MQAFDIHQEIVSDYKEYLQSFNIIKDKRIRDTVDKAFRYDDYLPEPLIQFNPSFQKGAELSLLIDEGVIHPDLSRAFGDIRLFAHQEDAIRKGTGGKSFIVTSGTGSGKSLTFLGTIFHSVFSNRNEPGIKALLVYPMNALINSQEEEIRKYAQRFGDGFPVTFRKYTGQESREEKEAVRANPPDILLTNYMMLELILTRSDERFMHPLFEKHLRFLVFDELHTYRGRQGADVAMLIRRLKSICKRNLQCIGTSATMVSDETVADPRMVVADFASTIFAEHFDPEQVIEERLEASTNFQSTLPSAFDLQEAIHRNIPQDGSADAFRNHPLAIWLENNIALKRDPNGIIRRAKPVMLQFLIESLSLAANEEDTEKCKKALYAFFAWSETLNIKHLHQGVSFMPFKIHQFVSQTGNVYVTLEPRETRQITLQDGLYVKETSGEEKTLFPVLFSRYTGYDFVCVRKNFQEMTFEPREPIDLPERITKDELRGNRAEGRQRRILYEEDFEAGYLLLQSEGDLLWSDEHIHDLPDTWLKTLKGGIVPDNFYEHRLPAKVYFNNQGRFSNNPETGFDHEAWFIAAPLILDPTSGVVFDTRTKENTKLMRVGNVGKSTATTITTLSILKSQFAKKVPVEEQKVLSFTDNRQDASLQAGHFNDFLMVGRLRSAIYHALKAAPDNRLTVDNIAEVVLYRLNLTEEEYARNPADPDWPDPENQKAIRDYITLRVLHDLRRGWRFNTPNLEQCALLQVDYARIAAFCQTSFMSQDPLLECMDQDERLKFLVQVLNYFRTAYAFDYYMLDETHLLATEDRLKQRLHPEKEWGMEPDERFERPCVLVCYPPGETRGKIFTQSIGPASNLGKYIKRVFALKGLEVIRGKELAEYIESLCTLLKKGHFLSENQISGKKGEVRGFRLRVEQVIWQLGDGQHVLTDETRIVTTGGNEKLDIKPNQYFRRFYQQDFQSFNKFFRASEHTGQIGAGERIDREKKFREGEISALYCSPTMELGIDISSLNVVHMRNVPPNPANYTQRSGRAGRSGQTALVFTYCSYTSPHDRHYFKHALSMVAGEVKAPRIDLINEELLATHLNAYILMQLGLEELEKASVESFIILDDTGQLPMKQSLMDYIQDQMANFGHQWVAGFKQVTDSLQDALLATNWFNDDWLQARCREFPQRLDNAFDRWRRLFRSAVAMIIRGTAVINDPTIASGSPDAREARRMMAIGGRQRDLLLNKISRHDGTNDSEFYVYRYLAAEGFLPGYNFTRLPVRVYVGKRNEEKGTFISRPRFIALREFGPGNMIYHDGGKHRITRMQFTESDLRTHTLKFSKKTGYAWLGGTGQGINHDPITGEILRGQDVTGIYHQNLLELVESEATPVERISSEEEDRMSTGYEIEQYFHFSKGIESTFRTTLKASGHPLLNLTYCPATQLIQVNKKWRTSKSSDQGFVIGTRSGKWLRQVELSNEVAREKDPARSVHLFTTDTADALYIQPVTALELDDAGVVSLSYALKRAIERVFLIEESEINVWFLGAEGALNILLYEAAEGTLGVLSQLVENTGKLREVFAEAYRVIQYDPETKEDTAPDKPKATYDDLLSYYNQRYHDKLDRHSIRAALELLMICEADNTKAISRGYGSREEHYQYLVDHYDTSSNLEKKLFDYLYHNKLRMPDRAQVNLSELVGFYISADFLFLSGESVEAIVFCDGSVHDERSVREDDNHKRQLLRDAGYDVIVWRYTEPVEKLVERRKDIFRKI